LNNYILTLLYLLFQIIEKLSVSAPSGEVKLKVLTDIAEEYNLAWDSSKTAAEFRKNHEDLLVT
jgi:vacuolar protein sorting-associated protein IST1